MIMTVFNYLSFVLRYTIKLMKCYEFSCKTLIKILALIERYIQAIHYSVLIFQTSMSVIYKNFVVSH